MEWNQKQKADGFRIERPKAENLPRIASLEEEIFSDSWTLAGMEEMLAQERVIFLSLRLGEELAGYGIVCTVLDEGDVLRLAIRERFRKKGWGEILLTALEEACRMKGVERLYLEVRQSNTPARNFYHKAGFFEEGIRRGFYERPKEDGICMKKILGGKEC